MTTDNPQLSDFDHISNWIRNSWDKIDSQLTDDMVQPFFDYLISLTSINQVDIFDSIPSSDSLHFYSNGKPDKGKTKEFLDNFDNFKSAFERAISTVIK